MGGKRKRDTRQKTQMTEDTRHKRKQEKVLKYVGMSLDYSTKGKIKISLILCIQDIF